LNLVAETDRRQMIAGIFRVLKPGGRVAISDIVCDEPVPEALKQNAELWSGCIAGAFQESVLPTAFREAGFLAATFDKWEARPWRVVEGIEFRSVTLTAIKGAGTPCLDAGHAVIYRGPFASVTDDEGHVYPRGERMAVCERSYRLLTEQPPYRDHFIGIAPAAACAPVPWCAPSGTHRPATETKGGQHQSGCDGGSGCC
jgi:SAM-dependent methyltransferase